jgi:hypothetical protein
MQRACGSERLPGRRLCKELKTRAPSLAGSCNSSWSVPPQWENGMRFPLHDDFCNIKSGLNVDCLSFQF